MRVLQWSFRVFQRSWYRKIAEWVAHTGIILLIISAMSLVRKPRNSEFLTGQGFKFWLRSWHRKRILADTIPTANQLQTWSECSDSNVITIRCNYFENWHIGSENNENNRAFGKCFIRQRGGANLWLSDNLLYFSNLFLYSLRTWQYNIILSAENRFSEFRNINSGLPVYEIYTRVLSEHLAPANRSDKTLRNVLRAVLARLFC